MGLQWGRQGERPADPHRHRRAAGAEWYRDLHQSCGRRHRTPPHESRAASCPQSRRRPNPQRLSSSQTCQRPGKNPLPHRRAVCTIRHAGGALTGSGKVALFYPRNPGKYFTCLPRICLGRILIPRRAFPLVILSQNHAPPIARWSCYTYPMAGRSPSLQRVIDADPFRRTMLEIHERLFSLYSALIVAEQHTYERVHGPVGSMDELIQLLLRDPWFTWLSPLLDLLLRIDQILKDAALDLTQEKVEHLVAEARSLTRPSIDGDGFERAYYEALNRAPEVMLAHFRVTRVLLAEAA